MRNWLVDGIIAVKRSFRYSKPPLGSIHSEWDAVLINRLAIRKD